MLIARVIGELTSSQKHPSHEGRKALLVQPLQLDGTNRGDAVVALDSVDAGVGDRVLLVTEGYSAMTAVGRPESPIDMAVIGVIDRLDFTGEDFGSGLIDNAVSSPAGPTSPPPLPLETLPAVAAKRKLKRKLELND